MAPVRLLPATLINQIAAGEVIERPASVVKELAENALDAGATSIELTLQKSGREMIRIADNGCGMSPADARLSLERHATSKIASFEDLTHVATMGFRGEALPSIASISYLTLRTRDTSGDTALEIRIEGGQKISEAPAAGSVGTTITVEHLFYNVPARRKFLKSDSTELGQCVEVVKALALAHPQVGWQLHEGRRALLQLPAGPTLKERLGQLFGASLADKLLPLSATSGALTLSGFISPLGHAEPSRQKIFFFVNGRPVDGKIFQLALRESYGAHMGPGRYPAVFLFLTLPPTMVDVNVHPAKREIRLHQEREKLQFIVSTLSQALNHPTAGPAAADFATSASPHSALPFLSPTSPPFTQNPFATPQPFPAGTSLNASGRAPLLPSVSQTTFRVAEALPSTHAWRFLSFLESNYGLFATPQGLAMVALSNAQERIAFEKIEAALNSEPQSQALLTPALLQLEGSLSEVIRTHEKLLIHQGFHLAPFGQGTWRLEAIPAWLAPENGFLGSPESFLIMQLHALADMAPASDTLTYQRISQLAAHHARHTPSHPTAARRLIDELLRCRQPLKPPSGAPTVWMITTEELQKRFGL